MNGGELIAERLGAHGVRFVFTLCGGHISPVLVGAKARGIRVVDVRHEVSAVFAADAVARLTDAPGVAVVTAGPGATNTITAVKNAQMAQSPVVLLGGGVPTLLRGRGALQDIDQAALFRPHVKAVYRARRVRDLAPSLDQAIRVACSGVPGPVFMECPVDVLYPEATVREWYGSAGKGSGLGQRLLRAYMDRHLARLFEGSNAEIGPRPRPPEVRPAAPHQVRRLAECLAHAERPVLLLGSQALLEAAQAPELAAAVSSLGLPVYLSGMARGLLGKGHPLQRRHKRRMALREADLVLLAGTPCDFRLDYGRQINRRATLISVNRSRRDLRKNRRPEVAVHADPGQVLRALGAVAVEPGERWASWHETLRARDQAREEEIDTQATRSSARLNPLRLCRDLDAALPEDSVLVADGGDFVATAAYTLSPRGPLRWLDPGPFGTLGVGAGFALGAKLCRPESEVWLLYGDGAAGFSLAEFDTFVRHDIPVLAIVGNDGCWSQIAREQVPLLGDDVGTVLRDTEYHRVAEGFGGVGFLVDRAENTANILARAREAVASGQPTLVNALLARSEFRQGSISM